MAILVPCLVTLRAEFNALNPERDKGADGWIGDSAHKTHSSDHNPDETGATPNEDADNIDEVHAVDIDSTGPWPTGRGIDHFRPYVFKVIEGEKKKWLSDSDKSRLKMVIFDKTIYHIDNNFEPRDYTGSDPHTNHAHFSSRYDTDCERDTRPFMEEDSMAGITKQDITDAVWKAGFGADNRETAEKRLGDIDATVPQILDVVKNINGKLDSISNRLTALESKR